MEASRYGSIDLDFARAFIWMTIAMIEPNEKKIIVVGGGGHGKVCIEILKMRNDYKIVGVVDSLQPVGSEILGVKVVGDHSILKDLKDAGGD